jgi:hypothetical protein
MNPLIAQITHRPFPEVAEILLTGSDQITREWDSAVREAMPQMRHLTFDEEPLAMFTPLRESQGGGVVGEKPIPQVTPLFTPA